MPRVNGRREEEEERERERVGGVKRQESDSRRS